MSIPPVWDEIQELAYEFVGADSNRAPEVSSLAHLVAGFIELITYKENGSITDEDIQTFVRMAGEAAYVIIRRIKAKGPPAKA